MTQKRFLNLLLLSTLSFIAGIIFAIDYPLHPEPLFYFVSILSAVGPLAVVFTYVFLPDSPLRQTLLLIILAAFAFFVGWGRYSSTLMPHHKHHLSQFTDSEGSRKVTLTGTVIDQPSVNRKDAELLVKPEMASLPENDTSPTKVTAGRFLIQVSRHGKELSLDYGQVSRNEVYGDRIEVTGTLQPFMPRKNPGGFNYRGFMNRKGIYGAIWSPDSLERVEKLPGHPVVAWSLELQTELLRVIKKTMPHPYSAFLGGSTLGLRGGLEYAKSPFGKGEGLITEEFKAAGTYHVLAVSGLHVGVVAGVLLAVLAGLRLPGEIYAPILLAALVVFTVITGARPATIRAAIMTGLIIIGLAYLNQGLRDSVIFGLALSALLILLFRPRLINEASFTLSFSAVLCLAVLTGPIESLLEHIR
ncbi:MAG: ComEC/Rec2 family competence protein, partial [bacterium]